MKQTTTTTTVAISKNTLLFSKKEVDDRFNAKNKYTDLTVPQDFAVSTNALNLSTALWQEIDMINIIANKQILGKSDWASVGVTTTTAATFTPSSSQYINSLTKILENNMDESNVTHYGLRVAMSFNQTAIENYSNNSGFGIALRVRNANGGTNFLGQLTAGLKGGGFDWNPDGLTGAFYSQTTPLSGNYTIELVNDEDTIIDSFVTHI